MGYKQQIKELIEDRDNFQRLYEKAIKEIMRLHKISEEDKTLRK